jgi:hypothetical protein
MLFLNTCFLLRVFTNNHLKYLSNWTSKKLVKNIQSHASSRKASGRCGQWGHGPKHFVSCQRSHHQLDIALGKGDGGQDVGCEWLG